MPTDMAFQFDLSVRLVAAALLGAGLGLEREVHGHPAGMRTHMLVSLGSAIFTVLSIYAFREFGTVDPSRIAAQIVTGIGFLGAGAIVKFGPNVRGLTTAGSLWVVSAIGMGCGAGAYFVAVFGTLVAMLALWPLHLLVQRLEAAGAKNVHLRLRLKKLDAFASVSEQLLNHHVRVASVQSRKAKGGQIIDLEVRLPSNADSHEFFANLEQLRGVTVEAIDQAEEA